MKSPHLGLRSTVEDYRPNTGAMGVLYQQRRSLYWLVVVVAVLAYAGLVAFLGIMAALVALAGANALVATAGGEPWPAYAWLGYVVLSFGALIGGTYLAAYIAGQYEVGD